MKNIDRYLKRIKVYKRKPSWLKTGAFVVADCADTLNEARKKIKRKYTKEAIIYSAKYKKGIAIIPSKYIYTTPKKRWAIVDTLAL